MSIIFKNNQPENSNSIKISALLKYAIIEISLVVIGILLALQINNWNENRLLNIQKEENLINLKSAIQKDINLLKTIESFNDFRFNSLSQVLKWSNNSVANLDSSKLILKDSVVWNKPIPEEFEKNFFDKTITYIQRPRIMIIHSYAMEEIKNSGIYSKIKNKHLKNLVNDYYSDLYWVFGDDKHSSAIVQLSTYLRENYNLLISDLILLDYPIKLIEKDLGLQLIMRSVISDANWRNIRAEKSKVMALQVLEELNKEIKRLGN